MAELEGRLCLMTGGAGGLGRSVVKKFLEAGAELHLPLFGGEEESALREHLGDGVEALHLYHDVDLSNPDAVDELLRGVREEAGRLPEVLLNLAGGFAMSGIEETDPKTWERMWQMNATTAFLCSRAVFSGMKERGWGRIVNVAAFPALELGSPALSAYGAAKAAVLNLTRTLAREGVEHGITANAILPSIIDTPGNREAMPESDTSAWIPPAEIAGVLLFLVSQEARIVNGAALTLTLG